MLFNLTNNKIINSSLGIRAIVFHDVVFYFYVYLKMSYEQSPKGKSTAERVCALGG